MAARMPADFGGVSAESLTERLEDCSLQQKRKEAKAGRTGDAWLCVCMLSSKEIAK